MNPSACAYIADLSRTLLATQVRLEDGTSVVLDDGAERAAAMILKARDTGRTAFVVGNGGSAAIASHVHNDLSKAVGMRAMAFNDPPLLTALANDLGYGTVFEHPLDMWAQSGDLLLAISSSGRSENILRAARQARQRGAGLITFSGLGADNPLRSTGDVNFYVPADTYGHVELAHECLLHFLVDRLCAIPKNGPATPGDRRPG